jgi:hypothetical protein
MKKLLKLQLIDWFREAIGIKVDWLVGGEAIWITVISWLDGEAVGITVGWLVGEAVGILLVEEAAEGPKIINFLWQFIELK